MEGWMNSILDMVRNKWDWSRRFGVELIPNSHMQAPFPIALDIACILELTVKKGRVAEREGS